MFPPTEEERKKFNLELCKRCLPHDMDTGGFFIALFRKSKPLGERARRKAEELEMQTQSNDLNTVKTNNTNGDCDVLVKNGSDLEQNESSGNKEDNICIDDKPKSGKKKLERNYEKAGREEFVEVADSVLEDIENFYGLSDSFARGQLMARGTADSKLLYFISNSVKENVFDRGLQNRIKGIHSGLRAFERRSRKDNNKG